MATMPHGADALTLSDLSNIENEPRIEAWRLAERLGYDRPRVVSELIERNMPELQSYGEVCRTARQTSENGGRPGKAYWLNEGQTLLVCMLSRTARAAAVRKEVIDVYMAFRQGVGSPSSPLPFPYPLDPYEGIGAIRVDGKTVYFDDRFDRLDHEDPVVALIPDQSRRKYRLGIVHADLKIPSMGAFGERTVVQNRGSGQSGGVLCDDCIALGRIVQVDTVP
ncbi:hypothetical protein [Fodinicurvata sp. EGI_FJ10296]|uniref:hypothetical protein n=1 Tax=Fodinicurvata sp. EGI_FJ10296 TaxID=3231908 RepID=UPI003452E8A8